MQNLWVKVSECRNEVTKPIIHPEADHYYIIVWCSDFLCDDVFHNIMLLIFSHT